MTGLLKPRVSQGTLIAFDDCHVTASIDKFSMIVPTPSSPFLFLAREFKYGLAINILSHSAIDYCQGSLNPTGQMNKQRLRKVKRLAQVTNQVAERRRLSSLKSGPQMLFPLRPHLSTWFPGGEDFTARPPPARLQTGSLEAPGLPLSSDP